MNFIIPMAGRGSRFSVAGFHSPKMLIKANEKTLLEWSLESLPLHLCTNLIFIALDEHNNNNKLEDFIYNKYPKLKPVIKFVFLKSITRGQAETVLQAKNLIDKSKDLLIFNIDTRFSSKTLEKKLLSKKWDGILGAFISNDSKYSFAKINSSNQVIEVAEKVAISKYALTGLYHFKNPNDFIDAAEEAISNEETVKNEFYIAPLYNKLISRKRKIVIDQVDNFDILGTPEELETFLKKTSN
jgi:dTDP-glucose pyrophosphorylase